MQDPRDPETSRENRNEKRLKLQGIIYINHGKRKADKGDTRQEHF